MGEKLELTYWKVCGRKWLFSVNVHSCEDNCPRGSVCNHIPAEQEAGGLTSQMQNFILQLKPCFQHCILLTLVKSISLPVICYRYIHNQDWQNAQRVAEEHDPDSLSEVLLGQAKDVFSSKNYPHFESLLLRAQRPELIIKYYQVIRGMGGGTLS